MKATRLLAYGATDQFEYDEIPRPMPGPRQLLIKVEASSLNPVEIYVRQGSMAKMVPLTFPAILGLDLAGTVVELGSGSVGFKVGDRVIGKLPINGHGSNAEFILATPDQLARLSKDVSFAEGATLPLAGLTGRQAVDAVGAKAGDRVLVTGALGAVGRAAIQYLKQIGATPVAGVRGSRIEEARKLGIDALDIDGNMDERSIVGSAIDTIGGAVATNAIRLVRSGGKLAAVAGGPEGANADGRITVINVWTVDDGATLQKIADAAASGELSIPIAKTFKLSEVAEGHKLMSAGKVGGKIIFIP
jgi:NADPH:quinone reductase-like Zn-dependent oxidoreductase